jgi:23S rRNA pseudouridine1911/1915/1917 synthase
LQAARLGLIHPSSGKPRLWSAPMPADFADLLQRSGIAASAADFPDEEDE